MKLKKQIVLLSRKRYIGQNSIEEIFESIKMYLGVNSLIEVPCARANFISLLRNLIFSYKHKGTITHIIGDIHYTSIVTGKNTILTIHDLNLLLRGGFFKKFLIRLVWFWLPAHCVFKITVVSEFTKRELTKVIPFAKNKISVIYNPYNEIISFVPKHFNSQKPIILHIGTKPNKNLLRTIEALKNISCELIVVGILDKTQLVSLENSRIPFSNYINITFEEINKLYAKCDIVSFPSLYEGFGMPILEGNLAGRAVLTSNICSMPEIAGNSACLVDPYSVNSIRTGFLKIIIDVAYRENIIENGFSNIERFHPKNIAYEYFQVYNSISHLSTTNL